MRTSSALGGMSRQHGDLEPALGLAGRQRPDVIFYAADDGIVIFVDVQYFQGDSSAEGPLDLYTWTRSLYGKAGDGAIALSVGDTLGLDFT